MDEERVELVGELIRRTDRGVLLKYAQPGGKEVEEWFPRSQLEDQDWVDRDRSIVSCTIPRWLAEDRGVV